MTNFPKNRKKSLENLGKDIAEKYYTAQEAQRRLGMTKDMFNHYVKQGMFKKTTIIGSHGYYLKSAIDAKAETIEYALLTAEESDFNYHPATVDDLDTLNRLAFLNFGELSRSPERIAARKRYLELNPFSTFVLTKNNRIVASLDIIPMKHEAVLAFREGKRGWQFPDEMIEQFIPGHRLECIIIDVMTTTNASPGDRARYASFLLNHFGSETLVDWGHKGIDIATIDACGGFEFGKRLLTHAGFENLGIKANNREIYHLDLEKSDLRGLQLYKQALFQHNSK